VHELSSLFAEPGSPRQCVHADTIHLPCPQYPDATMAPLYTCFVALQDVRDGDAEAAQSSRLPPLRRGQQMGHTVFLPRTHTAESHLLWNAGSPKEKEKFLAVHPAAQSALKTGDAVPFDSRVLHCGRENSSDVDRVLFYFTVSAQRDWPLPNGLHGSNSLRPTDAARRWTLGDFGLEADG